MNKLLITLTASLFWVAAFGQGKLQFANDTSHLIYFSPDTGKLAPADATKWVNGYPLAGSGAYTGSGSTIAALAGSPGFVAALYGGASPCALVLLTTTTIDDINNEGAVVPVNLVLNGFQAGAPIWLQVQVYDSRSANATDAWDWGRYA